MKRHLLIALPTFTGIVLAGIACRGGNAAEPAGVRPPIPGSSAVTGTSATWPKEVQEVSISSTADGTMQPALFWEASGQEERPLLVALHSWSGDYRQTTGVGYATRCRERRWHFLHPNFRGVNSCPAATCSDLAVTDVLDAVEFARHHARVDSRRIYLVGVSGGGRAALQVLAQPSDRLSESIITELVQNVQVPEALRSQDYDSTYGANTILFRRESSSVRITLFDGGHEIVHDAAFAWLARQSRPSDRTQKESL